MKLVIDYFSIASIDQDSRSLKMWHEARKQERKIRGLMVDFKKRADRRREFYEKIVSSI